MRDYREHADTYRAMLGDYGWGFNYDESKVADRVFRALFLRARSLRR